MRAESVSTFAHETGLLSPVTVAASAISAVDDRPGEADAGTAPGGKCLLQLRNRGKRQGKLINEKALLAVMTNRHARGFDRAERRIGWRVGRVECLKICSGRLEPVEFRRQRKSSQQSGIICGLLRIRWSIAGATGWRDGKLVIDFRTEGLLPERMAAK